MSRRMVVLVAMGVLTVCILLVAGLLWARPAPTAQGGDFVRCPATCNTLIRHYAQIRPTLKAHDGDKQCWQTCDVRFNQSRNANSPTAMKAFWSKQRATNLHTNQCAQACWRKFHKGQNLVTVAGRQSEPRPVACAPGTGSAVASRPE